MRQDYLDTVKILKNQQNESYIDHIKKRMFSTNYYTLADKELRIVFILFYYGVSDEDILRMTTKEGLAYIYLFGN